MDPDARFEELYRRYADRVHAYARRRTNATTADDVVADVFLVVWRRLDRVPEEPLPWLLRLAWVALASGTPASLLGLAGAKGAVAAGHDADLVVLDDDLHVSATLIGGRWAFNAL